jgi:hypothetical protein
MVHAERGVVSMKAVPLSSQNTVEFTSYLPFSQHSLLAAPIEETWQNG